MILALVMFLSFAWSSEIPGLVLLEGMGHLAKTATIPAVKVVMQAGPSPAFYITDMSEYWPCDEALRSMRRSTAADAVTAGLTFLDKSDSRGRAAFEALAPDIVYVQTPGSDHFARILSHINKSRLVLVEKPFLTQAKHFIELTAILKTTDTKVYGVDHGRTALILNPAQKRSVRSFLGAVESIDGYWMEDSSASDPGAHLMPGLLPHEREPGRDETFREGMSVDQVGHVAAMADLFADVASAKLVEARAARYAGSIGRRDTMSTSTWNLAPRSGWSDQPVRLTVNVGKGIGRVERLGISAQMHGLVLHGKAGRRVHLNLDAREIVYHDRGGTRREILNSESAYVITMRSLAEGRAEEIAFPVSSARAYFGMMETLLKLIDQKELATYPVGILGQSAPSLEETIKRATKL